MLKLKINVICALPQGSGFWQSLPKKGRAPTMPQSLTHPSINFILTQKLLLLKKYFKLYRFRVKTGFVAVFNYLLL